MFNFSVENSKGQKLELNHCEDRYQIISIDGLNPPNATIKKNTIAGMDGSKIASMKLEDRNIVILVKINGDVEENRHYLYKFFGTKKYVKIYYKNSHRDVYTEGYVETIENNPFSESQTMQVSIICPDPYWRDVNLIEYRKKYTEAQFTIGYAGDDDCDVVIEFEPQEDVSNFGMNYESEDQGLGYITIKGNYTSGDKIIVYSNKNKRMVTLTRNGVTSNILKKITYKNKWPVLHPGDNKITVGSVTYSNMIVTIKYRNGYEGV